MSKYLVIVESPAKSKTIQKFLGKDFEIQASFGHVRDLPAYTLGVNVDDNYIPNYQDLKDKKKVLKNLKDASKKVETVYIATDPDREGEAIAWHIQQALDLTSPKLKRVVFNEITQRAVTDAIENPREINLDVVDAQQARRILDRLIGYKLSPILAKKIKRGLSAGRVQSVAVKMICDREKEILAFVPEEYWNIDGVFKSENHKKPVKARLFALDSDKNKLAVTNEKDSNAILAAIKNSAYQVESLKKTKQNRNPSPPFITSTLQQDASRKLNWSAKKTMMIAQQLYEGIEIGSEQVGLITYMRTDSTRLSDEAKSAAKSYIEKQFGEKYLNKVKKAVKNSKSAQDAHEAIRPTYADKTPDVLKDILSTDHAKLYKLIWERFMASQMAPSELENTQVIIKAPSENGNYLFKATGHIVLFDGFTRIYLEGKDHDEEEEEESSQLPPLVEGEKVACQDINAEQKFTQPPPRFTEARLVKEMEEKGIGRPSTYAPTISTILDRGYVNKDKRTLFPTELGMIVNDKLEAFFSKIVDTGFTANLETQLDEIMDGKHKWQDVVDTIYQPFTGMLAIAQEKMEKVNTDKPSDEICEKCGREMVIKQGRYGEFIACTGFPECKNTKAIQATLDVSCIACGSPLVEKRSKRGKVFYGCSDYPKCTFASWDLPVKQDCPTCPSKVMFVKKAKGEETTYCAKCNPPAPRPTKAKSTTKAKSSKSTKKTKK